MEAVHGHIAVISLHGAQDSDSCINTIMFNPLQYYPQKSDVFKLLPYFLFSLGLHYMKDLSLHFSFPVTPFSKARAPLTEHMALLTLMS